MIRGVPVQRPPCVGCRNMVIMQNFVRCRENASTRAETTSREVSFMWLSSCRIDLFICKIRYFLETLRNTQSFGLWPFIEPGWHQQSVPYSTCAKTSQDILVRLVRSFVHYCKLPFLLNMSPTAPLRLSCLSRFRSGPAAVRVKTQMISSKEKAFLPAIHHHELNCWFRLVVWVFSIMKVRIVSEARSTASDLFGGLPTLAPSSRGTFKMENSCIPPCSM